MNRAMRFPLLALSLCACLCFVSPAVGAEKEELVDNPAYKAWAKHKPGTSVTYENKLTGGPAGAEFKTEIVSKLVEIKPENAVLEMTVKINIQGVAAPPAQKQLIPAKVKKSEVATGKLPPGSKGEMKEIGTEKVKVAGKTYDCKVSEFTAEQQGIKVKGKAWTSDDVPGQIVKSESTANINGQDTKTTMTLTKIDVKK